MITNNLKQLLEQRHLTQAELARELHIRPSTICDICNNNITFLKLDTVEQICRFFDCGISDFLKL